MNANFYVDFKQANSVKTNYTANVLTGFIVSTITYLDLL